jgi:predicted Ser/Thr protein kinase
MKKQDLKNKLHDLIKEEVSSIIAERTYKFGGLLNPDEFDPVDPEVHIIGFGTMARSALRKEIVNRLEGALNTAKSAASGRPTSYNSYQSLEGVLEDKGVLMQQIKAEIEIANELEELRTKGGRRAIPIPKQK